MSTEPTPPDEAGMTRPVAIVELLMFARDTGGDWADAEVLADFRAQAVDALHALGVTDAEITAAEQAFAARIAELRATAEKGSSRG